MLKIGLTGGIGCGKSTITNLFSELGVPCVDADKIAHKLIFPGSPTLELISRQFGREILTPANNLDRPRLRELIFTDPVKKQKLEAIMHPRVYVEIDRQLQKLLTAYTLISVPLLFETRMQYRFDRILVVDCPVELQIQRVRARDQLSEATIQAIIATQVPRAQRISEADDIIDNTGSTQQLAEQVKKLHNSYLTL